MENQNITEEEISTILKEKMSAYDKYHKYKEYNQNYHRNYYHNHIKGEKKQCECGLMVDIFRFARHRKQKKHFKALDAQENINNSTK